MAQVERLPSGADTDLAWTPVGDEIHLDLSMPAGLSDIRYDGSVPIPKRGEGEQLRLALREYEVMLTDESGSDGHITQYYTGTNTPFGEERPVKYRLVYADYITV